VLVFSGMTSKRVSFHARLDSDRTFNEDQAIVLPQVISNVGYGYSASTGRFRAPFSGTFAFVGTSELSNAGYYFYLGLRTTYQTSLDEIAIAGIIW
jgi:hypothetical protein